MKLNRATGLMFLCVIVVCFKETFLVSYGFFLERTELVYRDPEVIGWWDAHVRRLQRKAPYSFNANFTMLKPFGNNVTLTNTVYEKVNNEYLASPFKVTKRFCDWMSKDQFIFMIIKKHLFMDLSCPLHSVLIKNLTVDIKDVPNNLWPFVHNRLDFLFTMTKTNKTVLLANLYFKYIEKPAEMAKKTN